MPVMDEFREEREALKHGTPKQKIQYFFDYYKWYVIGGAAVLIFAGWLIHDMVTSTRYAFFGAFINTFEAEEQSEAFLADFREQLLPDSAKYTVGIDTSMSIAYGSADEETYVSVQKLTVYLASGDLDVVAMDAATFDQYASTDSFYDLRELLTTEQLSRYASSLYYIDMAEVDAKEEAANNGDYEYIIPEYDHFDPASMADPYPLAICIQDSQKLEGCYYFTEDVVPMAVPLNTKHLDEVLTFIDYLME